MGNFAGQTQKDINFMRGKERSMRKRVYRVRINY